MPNCLMPQICLVRSDLKHLDRQEQKNSEPADNALAVVIVTDDVFDGVVTADDMLDAAIAGELVTTNDVLDVMSVMHWI